MVDKSLFEAVLRALHSLRSSLLVIAVHAVFVDRPGSKLSIFDRQHTLYRFGGELFTATTEIMKRGVEAARRIGIPSVSCDKYGANGPSRCKLAARTTNLRRYCGAKNEIQRSAETHWSSATAFCGRSLFTMRCILGAGPMTQYFGGYWYVNRICQGCDGQRRQGLFLPMLLLMMMMILSSFQYSSGIKLGRSEGPHSVTAVTTKENSERNGKEQAMRAEITTYSHKVRTRTYKL